MAVLIVTTPFGLSLLAAWILFKVVIYEVPRGTQRMTVKRGRPGSEKRTWSSAVRA